MTHASSLDSSDPAETFASRSKPASPAWLTWSRRAALAAIALLPLAAWPGIERPFSTPKLYLLVLLAIVLGPFAWAAAARARASHATPRATGGAGDAWLRAAAMVWLASFSWSALLGDIVSPEALLLAIAGGLLALILRALAPEPEALAAALIAGPTGVALVALLQWLGVDPFALAGWVAPIAGASPRLRIYATLGNPNFVAALLTAAVPLTVSLLAATSMRRATVAAVATTTDVVMTTRVGTTTPVGVTTRVATTKQVDTPARATAETAAAASALPGPIAGFLQRHAFAARVVLGLALAMQLCAIAATGSRAAALGLVAAGVTALTMVSAGRGSSGDASRATSSSRAARAVSARRVAGLAALTIAIAALFVAFSPARPLGDTLAGRLYIWRVTAPHALDVPLAGRGPGAFELLHPAWEAEARPPADHPDARFAGPQQHAHNDYLEALVDRGVAGPVTILLPLATLWAAGGRRARRAPGRPVILGAAAAAAALAAVACVDFPLARPAELAMWWSALALAQSRQADEGLPDPDRRGHA